MFENIFEENFVSHIFYFQY